MNAAIWRNMERALHDDAAYCVLHHEEAVELWSGRKPSNRPVVLQNGRTVRIEFLGTFSGFKEARAVLEHIIATKGNRP